jgi:DNA-binding response OmpR family regulator
MTSRGGPSSTVLVIEDDAALRQLYRYALAARGLGVVMATDGLAALARLDEFSPAAIVLDLGLPRLPGRVVLDELLASHAADETSVVVVTALEPTALPTGVTVLRKPVDADDLAELIERRVRAASRRQGPRASA